MKHYASQRPEVHAGRRRAMAFAARSGAVLAFHKLFEPLASSSDTQSGASFFGARNLSEHLGSGSFRSVPLRHGRPSFFIHINISGGLSPLYLFDARPRAFTAAGLVENYGSASSEPTPFPAGPSAVHNHTTSWVSPAAASLLRFKNAFSVLNGVHMATSFQGHDENSNMVFAHNPFGGAYFAPALVSGAAPLGFVLTADPGLSLSNLSEGLLLSSAGLVKLAQGAGVSRDEGGSGLERAAQMAERRMNTVGGQGRGLFSQGARLLSKGFSGRLHVTERLVALDETLRAGDDVPNEGGLAYDLAVAPAVFQSGLSRAVSLEFNVEGTLDAHAATDAAEQPATYRGLAEQLARFFEFFENALIAFDGETVALKDHCAFIITSEFGRTLRQRNRAIDQTGTDHNPFGNSVLIGGAGVRTGHVFGSTDLDELDEAGHFRGVSPVHQRIDLNLLSAMGRPIDPLSGRSLPFGEGPFDASRQLNMGNIINTLLDLYGSPGVPRMVVPGDRTGRVLPRLEFLLQGQASPGDLLFTRAERGGA